MDYLDCFNRGVKKGIYILDRIIGKSKELFNSRNFACLGIEKSGICVKLFSLFRKVLLTLY
jgi:hypothetical protein